MKTPIQSPAMHDTFPKNSRVQFGHANKNISVDNTCNMILRSYIDKVLLILQHWKNPTGHSLGLVSTRVFLNNLSMGGLGEEGVVNHIQAIHIPSLSAYILKLSCR